MTTETTERDLITEVDELLAKATPGPLTLIRYEHGGGRLFREGETRDLIADFYNEGDRELYAASPDLLRRMRDEIVRNRELLRACLPYVLSSAEASRMMDGFEPQEHSEDRLAAELVDAIGDGSLRARLFKKPKGPFRP